MAIDTCPIVLVKSGWKLMYNNSHSITELENILSLSEAGKTFKMSMSIPFVAKGIEEMFEDKDPLFMLTGRSALMLCDIHKMSISDTRDGCHVKFRVGKCTRIPLEKALLSYVEPVKEIKKEAGSEGQFKNLIKLSTKKE